MATGSGIEADLPEFLRPQVAEPAGRPVPDARRAPGEGGLWVLIFGDLTVFAAFFIAFAWARRQDPVGFSLSAEQLAQPVGLVNTLVLLTSSLVVVLAVHAFRIGQRDWARRLLASAIACAVAFVVLKVGEYSHLLSSGHVPTANSFDMYYFVFTGIHLLHIVVGTALLTVVRAKAGAGAPWSSTKRFAEGSAVFWHLVDLLWIVLFTLFYLVGVA